MTFIKDINNCTGHYFTMNVQWGYYCQLLVRSSQAKSRKRMVKFDVVVISRYIPKDMETLYSPAKVGIMMAAKSSKNASVNFNMVRHCN